MELRQQDLSYSIAKVRLLPKVSMYGSYSYSNQASISRVSITQVDVSSESASLSANWTIFDGFSTRASKLSTLATRRIIERQRQSYVDATVDQITNMRHQLGFSSRAMSIAEVHHALFDAQVKRLNQDLSLGYASQATIDAGIVTLYAYEFNMAYARSAYYNGWTEFVSLAGIDPALANLPSRYVR
jgi:hypothetical protein